MIRLAVALSLLPAAAIAGDLTVENPMVPAAPPGVMVHAAYMTITNTGETARQLIGVNAEGYAMAHIHRTEIKDDIATMSSVDMIEIGPGQSVSLEHGGLHIMLMRPESPIAEGDSVDLSLEFADGDVVPVSAKVMPLGADSHEHGS